MKCIPTYATACLGLCLWMPIQAIAAPNPDVWTFISTERNGASVYIENESAIRLKETRGATQRMFWLLMSFPTQQFDGKTNYRSMKMKTHIDCHADSYWYSNIISSDGPDGNENQHGGAIAAPRPMDIVPGSLMANFRTVFCK